MKDDTGVRNGWSRARDLNLPRAKSQLVAESILGGFVGKLPGNPLFLKVSFSVSIFG